ncbi:SPFH domain-containing protein [Verrucomicrobiota bacterium]
MKKNLFGLLSTVLGICGLIWLLWTWGFCRFYVEPNEMAIITAKIGKPLPADQILADDNQKGIRKKVLGEGRHFLNPIFYAHEIRSVITILPGKIGIVTSKVGRELPSGEFLADQGQKGIWRRVLGPGKYRINTYGYSIEMVDAVSIPVGYAGVVTSLSGNQSEPGAFARKNQKGVQEDILQPGLYYVNSKEFKVDVLEIGVNQVSLLGKGGGAVITKGQLSAQNKAMNVLNTKMLEQQKQKRADYLSKSIRSKQGWKSASNTQAAPAKQEAIDIERVKKKYLQGDSMATLGVSQFVEFPSRDGFNIRLDMTVEIELLPGKIAWIYSKFGDLPAVIDKIIMPQITSISRNKGSEYGAKDFIVGEGREKFQNELTKALATTLKDKNIIVHNALIRHVEVPTQILDPIQQASIAIEQDLTNKEKQNTAKKEAELNTQMALIDQRRQQVAKETDKIKAEIRADQDKQVAEIKAQAMKQVAEIVKDTSAVKANIVRKLETAKAEAIKKVEGEKAVGMDLKVEAFDDPVAYGLWEFANKLNKDVVINIIHTGPGTLWTDLEKARAGDLGGTHLIRQGQDKKKKK